MVKDECSFIFANLVITSFNKDLIELVYKRNIFNNLFKNFINNNCEVVSIIIKAVDSIFFRLGNKHFNYLNQ